MPPEPTTPPPPVPADPARHTCPRRAEMGMDRDDGPMRGSGRNLDTYEPGHGLATQQLGCSYCGSMEPGAFLQAVRDGAKIGPTDKVYKLYVEWPNPTPDRVRVHGSTYSGQPRDDGWVAVADLTDEQRQIAERDGSLRDGITHLLFGTDATVGGKFYTPHLSPEQSAQFYQLWQDNKVNWGYPGYPYARLYLPGLPPIEAQQ